MAEYPDYAPKKKRFRFFEDLELTSGGEAREAGEMPTGTEEPRFCLRCTDTPMKFFRTLKFQLDGYRPEILLQRLMEDESDPMSLSLLPLSMYVCPNCRRTELVWCLGVQPDGEKVPESAVLKYERTFERCGEQQLRKVLEGKEFNDDMKQAARNLLDRKFFGWK